MYAVTGWFDLLDLFVGFWDACSLFILLVALMFWLCCLVLA